MSPSNIKSSFTRISSWKTHKHAVNASCKSVVTRGMKNDTECHFPCTGAKELDNVFARSALWKCANLRPFCKKPSYYLRLRSCFQSNTLNYVMEHNHFHDGKDCAIPRITYFHNWNHWSQKIFIDIVFTKNKANYLSLCAPCTTERDTSTQKTKCDRVDVNGKIQLPKLLFDRDD